jgi:hypothetical protein
MTQAGSFRLSSGNHGRSIILTAPGTTIPVGDLYESPMALLHQTMQRYWKPQ